MLRNTKLTSLFTLVLFLLDESKQSRESEPSGQICPLFLYHLQFTAANACMTSSSTPLDKHLPAAIAPGAQDLRSPAAMPASPNSGATAEPHLPGVLIPNKPPK